MTETIKLTPARALIEAVKKIEEVYESADAFAKALGVDPGFYSRFKREKRRAGIKLLEALWKKYPALDGVIRDYISNGGKDEETTDAHTA
jgi:hypothetical protein